MPQLYFDFQPRTFLTKIDDSYPPVYYSGAESVIRDHYNDHYKDVKKNNTMKSIMENKAVPLNPSRIGKPLLKEPRFVRPSQNRMDEMKLVNNNETYTKIFDDGAIRNYISNDKVLKFI